MARKEKATGGAKGKEAKEAKAEGKVAKKDVKSRGVVEQARYDVSLPIELLERARKELVKEKYATPLRVAQKYNVTLSTARKIIKVLEAEGLLVKFGASRRSPAYVPASKFKELQLK